MLQTITAYMCYAWTPDEEAQVESLTEKEVCESLNLVSTEGFPFLYIYLLHIYILLKLIAIS